MSTSSTASRHRPRSLLLQWHITERCNLRCAHCYQDSFSGDEPDFKGLLTVLDQFKELLASWNVQNAQNAHNVQNGQEEHAGNAGNDGTEREKELPVVRGHITVTGGEPFIRSDFMELLQVFASHKDLFSFAVLTNGSFIDRATACRLGKLKPSFVQVSMEGGKDTHNRIRGHGAFERAVSGIRLLVGEGVRTFLSFTAHRDNYREFPEVAETARRLKVARVWADRYIPGRADAPAASHSAAGHCPVPQPLTSAETLHFFRLMREARPKGWRRLLGGGRTEVAMHRGLQFLVAGGIPYHCTAGDTLITIQPNGDLYPCRRMPIKVGNVFESHLAELYQKNEFLHALRDVNRINRGCGRCFFARICRGGLRCLSYALTGSPFNADPGCPLALATPPAPVA